ncbi:hypothetical protein L2E82_20775 [Cichorium intybus]|uniref:Uncharacterized protein n=1 Tax=Cichorium intybus TaxID=13427 RepID=A0ACB9DTY8_CICIN|nr:hypothetical protein L2E82_20775 [Cichorium intybus]
MRVHISRFHRQRNIIFVMPLMHTLEGLWLHIYLVRGRGSGEEDDYVGGGAGFSVSSIGEGFEADDGGGGGDFARDSG